VTTHEQHNNHSYNIGQHMSVTLVATHEEHNNHSHNTGFYMSVL